MRKRRLARRLLSLLLIAQLLCAQMTAVFAASLEEEVLQPPEAGEELMTSVPFSESSLDYYYKAGYGVDFGANAGAPYAILDYERYFAVETAVTSGYGGREFTDEESLPMVEQGGKWRTFCVLPTAEEMGRVPDRVFEGWYIYPSGTKNQGDEFDDPRSWLYDESTRRLNDLLEYREGDAGYAEYGHLGGLWTGVGADYTGDGYGMTPEGYPDLDNPVSIVGRWVPSGIARAAEKDGAVFTARTAAGETATINQFYPDKIDGTAVDEATAVAFDPGVKDYWIRVGADVTELDLVFNAYEPYFDYNYSHIGEAPVTVTATFDGETTYRSDGLVGEMLPRPNISAITGSNSPTNALDNPAHSQWTVEGIQLRPSAGDGKRYNDITVTIVPPNGDEAAAITYTFHVQRLAEPTLTREPGNTPFGMIERDSSVVWGVTQEERDRNKAAAKEKFVRYYKFDSDLYPMGPENQSGSIFRGTYGASAWPGAVSNVDLDSKAIVVYQDAAFLDPGISLTDAEGNPVKLGEGAYAGTVERTLKLRTADALTVSEVWDGAGADCWYAGGELSATPVTEAVSQADGSDRIDLRGLKVLPGVYSLEYSYTDPVSGAAYDSAGKGFTDPARPHNENNFRRTLVVLPAPGDVDMDGAVTAADAVAFENAIDMSGPVVDSLNGAALSGDGTAALFAYRVCDLTHSNTLEKADLDSLAAGYSPVLNKGGDSDYYYLPLPTGEDASRYTRRPLAEGAAEDTANLTMRFMGKEQGVRQSSGATLDPVGPDWSAGAAEGVTLGDTFWLGVELTDSQKSAVLNRNVDTFSFTLTYDSRYVEPAVVLTRDSMDTVGSNPLDWWRATMRIYNLGGLSNTIWASSDFPYDLTAAAGYGKEYTTHYSKAITPLERGAEQKGNLKELVFSIQLKNGYMPANLQQDGWLLAVPFTLVKHPYGQTAAQLVEMGAGMREFVFVGEGNTSLLANLFSLGDSQAMPAAAYSAQDEIFGGATANLSSSVSYTGAGASIPLGEDKTEVTVLYNELEKYGGSLSTTNAVYSTEFYCTKGGKLPMSGKVEGTLPPGIRYENGTLTSRKPGASETGDADGPEAAGIYDFSIATVPYRIVVEKAPLHFWADNQATYYGQPMDEFRGEQNPAFTFSYDTGDILGIERKRAREEEGAEVNGKGADLAALLADGTYQEPAFTAVKKDGAAVDSATGVGTYAIKCPLMPLSNNYEFIYTPERPGGEKGLTILQRPFQVKKLAPGTVVGEIYSDMPGILPGLNANLSADDREFVVELPQTPGQAPGYYNGYPVTAVEGYLDGVLLPDDSLSITYTGTYVRERHDLDNEGFFTLQPGNVREPRNVNVSEIRLTGAKTSNYKLVPKEPTVPTAPVEGEVTGSVTRRNIVSIEISQLPSMKYLYGAQLNGSSELHFYIKRGNGAGAVQEGEYSYNPKLCAELGIRVTWATQAQKDAGEIGDLDYAQGQTFTVQEYNGRYLCVSAPSADDEGKNITIVRYSAEPLVVTPRTLTLTAQPVERYYGEENGELTFTYPVEQLADRDRQNDKLKGEGKELLEVLKDQNYTPPTLEAVVSLTDRTPVDARTPYSGAKNAIIISGAMCAKTDKEGNAIPGTGNYVFHYTRSADGKSGAEWGDSTLMISRRLIVVDKLNKTTDLATVYADTKQIYTKNLPLSIGDAELSLPTHTEHSTTYYPRYGTPDDKARVNDFGYARTDVILPGDELSLTYTATVVPTDGESYIYYDNFAKGYYDMSGAGEDGVKEYPVQVSELALAGPAANNYALVFKENGAAMLGLPNETTVHNDCVDPEINNAKTYYVSGTGKVMLRPIESITILAAPKMTYIYGEPFAPDSRNPATRQRLTVSLNYTKKGDNYAGNTTEEVVEYRFTHNNDKQEPVFTFDDRSLDICWLAPGQKTVDPDQKLVYGQYITAVEHDGARLAVVSRRGENGALVVSTQPDPDDPNDPAGAVLQVSPRTLTLAAGDQRRCYGEPNGAYSFTFDEGELAAPDAKLLEQAGKTGADGSAALQKLAEARSFAYTAPAFSSNADQKSGVQGEYTIDLNGGHLDNYRFAHMSGELRIYPRPVKIVSFVNDPDKPIYTIYADTRERKFDTEVTNESFTLALPDSGVYIVPGTSEELPLSSALGAVCNNDRITLKIKVNYRNLAPSDKLPDNAAAMSHNVTVDSAQLQPGTPAASNYVLELKAGAANIVNPAAQGAVELRSINSITVKSWPKQPVGSEPGELGYQYGQTLDLDGLVVTINYDIIGGVEGGKLQDVPYLGTDQFKQYGLYVNYIGSNSLPAESKWESIKTDYRVAETGDHLTVAYTHDTQGTANPFTANNKYLIISAQRHAAQKPAEPQIVPLKITVSPKPLTFTLAARDKTYDGTTIAVGTLTFKDTFFRAEGYVDRYNVAGVVDQVYPVTGAAYEKDWDSLAAGGGSFQGYVKQNGYSFTTGEYVPAGPAPLGENYPLRYTEGYVHGREGCLSFDFLNANVAYETEPKHDSYGALAKCEVKCTGIRLAGPDAANYTIAGAAAGETAEITLENAASAEGYQGGALPKAFIHKANRAELPPDVLPKVEIDVHTNVLYLIYPQKDSAIVGGEAADWEKELHFEYALQYDATGNDGAALAQWAGADGCAEWWDEFFFGGEAFAPKAPEGYVPREEDLPKEEEIKEDTVLKGQRYRWSEQDKGFAIDEKAYPGGSVWPGYELYATARTALPRDTVFFPVVRAAETHNYNASPILSSVEGYTPELAQEVADANRAVAAAEEALADAAAGAEQEAAQDALDAALAVAAEVAERALAKLADASAAAKKTAQDETDLLLEIAESGKWPEVWPETGPAPAVKSYCQRIDVVSTEKKRSAVEGDQEDYAIPLLEAVWFTDILDYPEAKLMDVVLRNNDPVRYYGYAWDSEQSAPLKFDDKENAFTLKKPIDVEIKSRDEDGKETLETITVNQNHTALLYANTSAGGGVVRERSIEIQPRSLFRAVGDQPYRLEVIFVPRYTTLRKVTWASSDPTVATVDAKGVVSFVGPGTAVITATSMAKKTDSITVTVVEGWKELYPNAIFDLGYLDAFFQLKDDRFFPEAGMTRGEAAELLAQFYVPNPDWKNSGTGEFSDLSGEESYAGAARLLGSLGVFRGVPGGAFAGETPITRAEFITLLVRMLGLDTPNTKGQPHAFADAGEKDTWAYASIDAVSKTGVVQGVGGGRFAPNRVLTRAEAAVFLDRLLRYDFAGTEKGIVIPRDVRENYWARASILRAVNAVPPIPRPT